MNIEKEIRDASDKLLSAADAARNQRFKDSAAFLAEAKAMVSELQYECMVAYHTSGVGPV